MAYTKLDANITTSSIWLEGDDVLRAWIYLLATADADGCVFDTAPALALRCRNTLPRMREILRILSEPDPESRTPEQDGRRILIQRSPEWCITLVNHSKYRFKDHTNAARQKRHRERIRNGVTARPRNTSNGVTPLRVTQAEAEAEAEANVITPTEVGGHMVSHVSVVSAVSDGTTSAPIGSAVHAPENCPCRSDPPEVAARCPCACHALAAPAPEPGIAAAALARRRDIETVWDYWRTATGHEKAKRTDERIAKIRARLTEGYTVEQMKAAIDGCIRSPFHQGENQGGRVFDDLTLIFRTGSKLEFFAAIPTNGRPGTVTTTPARVSRAEQLDKSNTDVLRDFIGRGRT